MFADQLQSSDTGGRASIAWITSIHGLVRTPIFDPEHADRAFVVTYVEKQRSYEVRAFRPSDGTTLWSCNVLNGGYGTPAVRNGRLLVHTGMTNVVALDTTSGAELWRYDTTGRVRSSIAIIDDLFVFSSADRLVGLDGDGREAFAFRVDDHFLFGLVTACGGDLITCATAYDHRRGCSTLRVLRLARDGGLRWERDLGPADVVSSDSSAVCAVDGRLVVGTMTGLSALDAGDGRILWEHESTAPMLRAACTTDGERVYGSMISGHVVALQLSDGELVWQRELSEQGVWIPPTLLRDRLLVVSGGVLQFLAPATGERLQEIAVGHCPYSACTVRGTRVLLGAGDPPYHGLLFGFDLESTGARTRCVLEREHIRGVPTDTIDIAVSVIDAGAPVLDLEVDASSLGEESPLRCVRRDADTFVFALSPAPGRRRGIYALPARVTLASGTQWATVRLELEAVERTPRRIVLTDVPTVCQLDRGFSGAACLQSLRRLHGGEVDQADMREMCDRVLERAKGYSPYQLWRLVMRRAMMTGASKASELAELAGTTE